MKQEMAKVQSAELATLAVRCGELHRSIEGHRSEMRELLVEAKKTCGTGRNGTWLKWVSANHDVLGFDHHQAARYMLSDRAYTLYQNREAKRLRERNQEMSQALREQKADQAAARATQAQAVDVRRADRADVEKTQMALDLISAGYRALAMKFHPDKGGSAEQQAALTAARDRLVALVSEPNPCPLCG